MDGEPVQPSDCLWTRRGKRAFDVLVSLLLLVLLSPVLLLTAVAVKLTSRGPLFFSQIRAGLRGREFLAYKFRSMRAGRTHDPKEIVPLSHPDITLVGRVIRRLKIDEMPQLIHVLAGQMSLIGPRPTIPEQVARYDDFRRRRLLVRPGITGLAQVHGNTAIDWDERIRYDVWYVAHCTFTLDLWILWRTALTIVLGEKRFARPFDESFARVKPS